MRKIGKLIRSFTKEILYSISSAFIVGYGLHICIEASEHITVLDYLVMGFGCALLFTYHFNCRRKKINIYNLKEYYKSIVDIVPHGVCECDYNGIITYANYEYRKMMKCNGDELIGHCIWEFVMQPDRLKKHFEDCRRGIKTEPYSGRMKAPTGAPIDVLIQLEFRFDAGNERLSIISIFTNISELYELKEQLRIANEELEFMVDERTKELNDLNKELEAFTFAVSHDLNQPLRAITGFSNVLQTTYSDKLDSKMADFVKRIYGASKKMEMIIKEMLKLSRITVGDVIRVKCDASAIAEQTVENLRDVSDRKVNVIVQECMWAYADRDMIASIFDNLIDNSWKYTRDVVNPTIKVGCLNDVCTDDLSVMRHSVFYVDDNGIGFDMKHADKLFEAFYKLKFDRSYEGSGIGLSTVYRIVKKHNGDIWVESREGEGTTIYFTLDKYM